MNKFAKGSVAAGAGLVLLLGGVGTLAYWNDNVALNGGTINAGELSLEAGGGEWSQGGTTITDIEQFSLVPGDELSYTVDLQLTAEGDNIQGTVELDRGSLTFLDANGVENPELAEEFDIEFAPVAGTLPDSKAVTYDPGTETFSFDGAGAYAIEVEVAVDFPFDENDEQNQSQGASVNLDKLSFTATQTQAK